MSIPTPAYVLMWVYQVLPEHQGEFESAYGAEGVWVQWFRTYVGYLKTEFYQDAENPLRYVTADYWTSAAAYQHCKTVGLAEYQQLDQRFAAWTSAETFIGAFYQG